MSKYVPPKVRVRKPESATLYGHDRIHVRGKMPTLRTLRKHAGGIYIRRPSLKVTQHGFRFDVVIYEHEKELLEKFKVWLRKRPELSTIK